MRSSRRVGYLLSVLMVTVLLVPRLACAAASAGFDSLLSALEQHFGVHAQRPPMMGFVSLCAWAYTGGGVRGMRVAEIEHLPSQPNYSDLDALIRSSLGGHWQHFVTNRNRNGEMNLIYVQPDGTSMRMMIANYDNGELNVVGMELNGNRLAHWIQNPGGSVQRHDYGGGRKGSPD